jgi:hypothetical protein
MPSAAACRRSSSPLGPRPVAGPQRLGGLVQERGELLEHRRRSLSRLTQRALRRDGGRRERDQAADQRVDPPVEALRRGGDHEGDEHGLHGRLGDQQRAAVEQHRDRHGAGDDERDLPQADAGDPDEQVGDEHPDRDADGDLADPAQPLPVGHAQRDDRRDRREERLLVPEQVVGDPVGHRGRDGDLRDEERPLPQPEHPVAQVPPAAARVLTAPRSERESVELPGHGPIVPRPGRWDTGAAPFRPQDCDPAPSSTDRRRTPCGGARAATVEACGRRMRWAPTASGWPRRTCAGREW